ncbi:MAG: hypothetical protein CSA54_02685 [Gammaproteobacteria bacterium]|nr:MAG: hypothetical protein CSA54_02685 [Gammaproteobacteria bacterium]
MAAKRIALMVAGWLCVALGVAGIFLPLMPTVVFLLLAAACFDRSSPRLHQWLLQHSHLGPIVRQYQSGQGIPRKARQRALLLLWLSMVVSMLIIGKLWSVALLGSIGLGISFYLLKLPTSDTLITPAGTTMTQDLLQQACREIRQAQAIFTIQDSAGIPSTENSEGEKTMPFWSSHEHARHFIDSVAGYADFAVLEIPWPLFVEKWLPGLNADSLLAGLNWQGADACGFDLEPDELAEKVAAAIDASAVGA